jgi:predicted amidohydrolase
MTAANVVRTALVQSHWRETPEASLNGVLRLVEEIADPVDLIVLPEFFLGAPWYFPGRESFKGTVDQTIPGPVTEIFSEIARRRGCHIVCGTLVEREGDAYYNTAAVIDDRGAIIGKARKIHRYAAELTAVVAGDAPLIVDLPFGRLGVCVCSDFWIPETPRLMALRGAEILAVPGASIVQNLGITRPCIQANAAFNVAAVLYAGIVGSVTGERGGRSVTVSLGGVSTIALPERIVASLDAQDAVLQTTLDMDDLRAQREVDLSFKRSLYFCLHGRRPELYGGLTEPYVGASDLAGLLRRHLGVA